MSDESKQDNDGFLTRFTEPVYMACAHVYGGKYGVSVILPGCIEIKRVGDIREFDTWEEADDVARRLAAGEFPDIRPGGMYINNR